MSKKISFTQLIQSIKSNYSVSGSSDCYITELSHPKLASKNSLVWFSPNIPAHEAEILISETHAVMIVAGPAVAIEKFPKKCFIVTEDPKRVFMEIADAYFQENRPEWQIHPSAIVHPDAELGKNVAIGPFSYIGSCCELGDGARVSSHCYLDNVTTGKNFVAQAGVKIGFSGFGFEKNIEGQHKNFPHVGKVIIGDSVELGNNSCIDRGALVDTVIEDGVKIDNLVHIGHNVHIKEHALITAGVILGGSSEIGQECWVGLNSTVRDGVFVDRESVLGMGAAVVRDVPEKVVMMGPPARELLKPADG